MNRHIVFLLVAVSVLLGMLVLLWFLLEWLQKHPPATAP